MGAIKGHIRPTISSTRDATWRSDAAAADRGRSEADVIEPHLLPARAPRVPGGRVRRRHGLGAHDESSQVLPR